MTPEETHERRALYRDVQYERLSPAEADAQLRQWGQKPFQSRPDPSHFDPMTENEWTLPMAAAWFVWRSADAVRDQWNPSREGWRKWIRLQRRTGRGPPGPRLKLRVFGRATVADIFSQVGLPADSHAGIATARKGVASDHVHTPYSRIEDALRSGRLRATWGKREEGDFGEITSAYWRHKFDAIANPKRQSSPKKPNTAPVVSIAATVIYSKSTATPRTAAELPSNEMHTIGHDEIEDLPDLSLGETQKDHTRPRRRNDATTYTEDGDFFVRREDVILAEQEISRIEYEQPDWSLGQALGWIAYRRRESFRSLWETDLNPRPNYYGETYSTDFATDNPARVLREALLAGKPVGRIDGRSISPDYWLDVEVWGMRRIKFLRTDVIKVWAELEAPPSPQRPLPTDAELTQIHEALDITLGKISTVDEFYKNLRSLGIAPASEAVKTFQRTYLKKKRVRVKPGRRTFEEP